MQRFIGLELAVGGFVGAFVWWDSASLTAALLMALAGMAALAWLAMASMLLARAP